MLKRIVILVTTLLILVNLPQVNKITVSASEAENDLNVIYPLNISVLNADMQLDLYDIDISIDDFEISQYESYDIYVEDSVSNVILKDESKIDNNVVINNIEKEKYYFVSLDVNVSENKIRKFVGKIKLVSIYDIQVADNYFIEISQNYYHPLSIVGETEPNNSQGTAQTLSGYRKTVNGSISSNTDIDFFKFTSPVSGYVNLTLTPIYPNNFDIYLYNSAGT